MDAMLEAYCHQHGILGGAEAQAALERFEVDLYETNGIANLPVCLCADFALRHILDSLLIVPLVPEGSRVLDLGSGPGFPAWPLALGRPDLQVCAVDSSGKMTNFLKRHPLPNLTVEQVRAEDWGVRDSFDFVTARALAPLGILLELCAAPCIIGGVIVPFRTPAEKPLMKAIDAEVLGLRLERVHDLPLPSTTIIRTFPVYRKFKVTDAKYPRVWSRIKADPIGGPT